MTAELAMRVSSTSREKAERLTTEILGQLPEQDWTVFPDIRWPGREYPDIDHVVVGPGGVFVIDTKNWSGNIQVRRDVMRQNGRLRDKALSAAAEGALAIGLLVPELGPRRVQPVLCFAREEKIMGWGRNVMVCSTATVVPMLLTQPTVLSPAERQTLCRDLDVQFRAASVAAIAGPRRKTGPRHSAATATPGRPDHRAARRTGARKSSRSAGAFMKLGVLAVGAGLIAISPEVFTSAGHLVTRLLG